MKDTKGNAPFHPDHPPSRVPDLQDLHPDTNECPGPDHGAEKEDQESLVDQTLVLDLGAEKGVDLSRDGLGPDLKNDVILEKDAIPGPPMPKVFVKISPTEDSKTPTSGSLFPPAPFWTMWRSSSYLQ